MFSSEFRNAMQDAADAINDTMGEKVTVTPYQARPNHPASLDTSKEPFDVVAVFRNESKLAFDDRRAYRPSGRTNIDIAPAIMTREPMFSIKLDDLPYSINRQYRVTRHHTGDVYEVTSVKPDGVSRIDLEVVQLGRSNDLDVRGKL